MSSKQITCVVLNKDIKKELLLVFPQHLCAGGAFKYNAFTQKSLRFIYFIFVSIIEKGAMRSTHLWSNCNFHFNPIQMLLFTRFLSVSGTLSHNPFAYKAFIGPFTFVNYCIWPLIIIHQLFMFQFQYFNQLFKSRNQTHLIIHIFF